MVSSFYHAPPLSVIYLELVSNNKKKKNTKTNHLNSSNKHLYYFVLFELK